MKRRYQSDEHSIATQQNIRALMCHLSSSAKTAVDIGSQEGLLACALDNIGIEVRAYEANAEFSRYASEFIARNKQGGIQFFNEVIDIDKLASIADFDVALFLSVHHQVVQAKGLAYANSLLCEIYRKAEMQLFFQPALIYAKYGCRMPFIENDILGCLSYFSSVLEASGESAHAEVINITHNFMPPQEQYRPLFLFSKKKFSKGRRIPSIADFAAAQSTHDNHLVFVNVEEAVSVTTLQSFAPNHWHYMVAACHDIIAGKDEHDSILRKYYEKVQPRTMGDVFQMANQSTEIGPLKNYELQRTGIPFICLDSPWKGPGEVMPAEKYHCFGPQVDKEISFHVNLLRDLKDKIKRDGYSPELHIDGHIAGVVLKRGATCRFAVLSGQHRLAVLSSLGYTHFVAKLYPGFVQLLDYDKVETWPVVKSALYTRGEAQAVFDAIFDADGMWAAKLCCQ